MISIHFILSAMLAATHAHRANAYKNIEKPCIITKKKAKRFFINFIPPIAKTIAYSARGHWD
jgi:hypothetical protein